MTDDTHTTVAYIRDDLTLEDVLQALREPIYVPQFKPIKVLPQGPTIETPLMLVRVDRPIPWPITV